MAKFNLIIVSNIKYIKHAYMHFTMYCSNFAFVISFLKIFIANIDDYKADGGIIVNT